MELLEKAQRWAAKGHLGVYRKFGNIPYIVHPEAVVEIVSQVTDDNDVLAASFQTYIEVIPGTIRNFRSTTGGLTETGECKVNSRLGYN